MRELEQAKAERVRRERARPRELSPQEIQRIQLLGGDLKRVWDAPTTSERDKKEILRAVLEEVIITVERAAFLAHLTLRWKGGVVTEIDVNLPRSNPAHNRTDEDTVVLVRRLAEHYPDTIIAGILNRQDRTTGTGKRFTANDVGNLRRHRGIARFEPPAQPPQGELVSIIKAAAALDVAPSTLHRWLAEGLIAGEQITSGAPWRIRVTDELRARFVAEAPSGYVPMIDATKLLGVSRQTVLQRIKRGELEAVHVVCGLRKGLRIKIVDTGPDLFEQSA